MDAAVFWRIYPKFENNLLKLINALINDYYKLENKYFVVFQFVLND